MAEIIPSIIATTKEEFETTLKKLEPFTKRVHFDVLDGVFTAGKTILGYEELKTIPTQVAFDVHLMVINPQEYVPQWLMIPQAERIALSAESQGDLNSLISEIKGSGRKAGLVLNPETTVDSVLEYLPMIDYIQFMSVHPGSYGRPFLSEVGNKILNFHDQYPDIPIAVDGGMNPDTSRLVRSYGAQMIIAGSYILNSQDIGKAIEELKS